MNTQRTVLRVKNNEAGKQYIEQLRNEVKAHNLRERLKEMESFDYVGKFKRVDLYGRLGKNNPNRHKYSIFSGRSIFRSHTRIRLEDASHIAVYINNVVRSKFGGYTLVCS
jgi:hypothetical protein